MSGPRSEVSRSPATHNSASGTNAHRSGQFRIALVPDQPRHREHHHLLVRLRPARRGSAGGPPGSGRKRAGSRPLPTATAPRWMCSRRASRASASLTVRNVSVTRAASHSIAKPTARRGHEPGKLNQNPWHGIGDPRHARPPCRHPRQKAADRHMRVHEVGPLGAEQPQQCAERPPVRQQRKLRSNVGASIRNPSARGPSRSGPSAQTPITSCPRARIARISGSRNCASEKSTLVTSMIFKRSSADGGHARAPGRYPTLLIAHFTCCGPSA